MLSTSFVPQQYVGIRAKRNIHITDHITTKGREVTLGQDENRNPPGRKLRVEQWHDKSITGRAKRSVREGREGTP